LALIDHLPTHHDPPPPDKRIIGGSESRFADDHEPFFNSIGQKAKGSSISRPLDSENRT